MSKPGHNSGKGGPISADRLKSFIERIEKMIAERDAINGDIKDVYSEAKGVGYDVKTMRKIVQLRAMDAADRAEAETLLDTYCHALGMVYTSADYASEDALVEQASRIVSEVDRCMYLGGPGQLPTIRAIQEHLGCSTGKASKIRGLIQDRVSREIAKVREMKLAAEGPEDGDDGITESTAGPAEGAVDQQIAAQQDPQVARLHPTATPDPEGREGTGTHSNESPATPSVGAVADDDLDIPARLRGPSPANRRLST